MSLPKNYGKCHICGKEGKLSFEHIPPRKAFNWSFTRLLKGLEILQTLKQNDFENVKTKIHQRGSGDYTLCPKCNNDTGGWYGGAYVSWAYQAATILIHTAERPSLYYPFKIFPLRVLKQIDCMFFSANGPEFQDEFPELVKFVLNPEYKYFDNRIRVVCYYNPTGVARQTGIASLISLSGSPISLGEISYYPFGYILYIESHNFSEDIFDISFFSKYNYNDWKEISLKIPHHNIYTWMPGDFRTRDQVQEILSKR